MFWNEGILLSFSKKNNVHVSRGRIQKTILMDIFFGLVIVANGVMMGLTTQGVVDESSEEAQIFELVPWKIAWDINFTFKT